MLLRDNFDFLLNENLDCMRNIPHISDTIYMYQFVESFSIISDAMANQIQKLCLFANLFINIHSDVKVVVSVFEWNITALVW